LSETLDERRTTADFLPPDNPGLWPLRDIEKLYEVSWRDYEAVQLQALKMRFGQLKDSVVALSRLVEKQGVSEIARKEDVLPLLYDHRVMKNYPLSIIENRDFPKLTSWLNRMTTHDLNQVDLGGLRTLDGWLTRLDEFGMLVGHSTGTTGKLSFIPRSRTELPAWQASYVEGFRLSAGLQPGETLPTFTPIYRGGHQMGMKIATMFMIPAAGGPENFHTLYQIPLSADLMALAGRLQSAEDKGEIDKLGLDPALLDARRQMIEQGRRREQDVKAWFEKLINEYRGKRVKVGGSYGDLIRVALQGKAEGWVCDFAPGSVLASGGGMKGLKDAPQNWKELVTGFFGIPTITATYGMSECAALFPKCKCDRYHLLPHVIPFILDRDAKPLPREGVQTGRFAFYDLLAETYWGGFISGDQVTVHWDEDCACGRKGPSIEDNISRYAEMEGGDDKITCAGSQAAYNEFMDYVMQAE
jgi:hypothetical protein